MSHEKCIFCTNTVKSVNTEIIKIRFNRIFL
nr:MAG TPA: hypothetical protein [Caudoviricetes sp.]